VLLATNSDTIGSAFECGQKASENSWTQQQLDDCINSIP